MSKKSAGILLYRFINGNPEVLLVHPGGPFWAKKDLGAWSVPKGEFDEGEEEALPAAKRELKEELGIDIEGEFIPLTPIRQKSGKTVYAFAVMADFDTRKLRSNTFSIEWPPRSGKKAEFPEIDRAEWFDPLTARDKIINAQVDLLEELFNILKAD